MAWAYGLVAALSAVGCEIYYRANPGRSYVSLLLPWGMLLALLVNFAIWGLLQTENLLGATVVFTFLTAGLRLAWTLGHGEMVPVSTWVAFVLILTAVLVKIIWRTP